MFSRLFQSGQLGTMTVSNRIIMAPMLSCYTDGKYISDRIIKYYVERAIGGTGLIITEIANVDPTGQLEHNQMAVYDDSFIPGLTRLADAIHATGAKIAMQLGHGGRTCRSEVIGVQPVSASAIAQIRKGETPRELTITEIKRLIIAFSDAAKRAKQAGFDGVEIHCAHNYLLRQFISAYSNNRNDAYGGNIENRTRMAFEIVQLIKHEIPGFPVWVRINGDDYVPGGGITLEDSKTVARILEKAGADAISVSAGTYDSPQLMWTIQPMYLPPGCLLHLSSAIKNVVKVPVIAAGRINTPELAEQILLEGKADFVALGRALVADPEFPQKAAEGRSNEIRRCVADTVCMDLLLTRGLVCTVNAEVGKEEETKLKPCQSPKHVMIVGGGPAGMEAARIAAQRGHKVSLYESSQSLGGQLNIADKPPCKGDLTNITSFLTSQLTKYGVRVLLDTRVTPHLVAEINPDVIILATGATPLIPNIPGATMSHVVSFHDVLSGKEIIGEKVVVIGGGRVGVEVADYLCEKGKTVTIIEMLKRIGHDLGLSIKDIAIERLRDGKVTMMPETKAESIEKGTVVVSSKGKTLRIEADTVVLAVGSRPANELEKSLKDRDNLYVIGDCVEPRNIIQAIAEGARVAREI